MIAKKALRTVSCAMVPPTVVVLRLSTEVPSLLARVSWNAF